jgi:hypothetical protein
MFATLFTSLYSSLTSTYERNTDHENLLYRNSRLVTVAIVVGSNKLSETTFSQFGKSTWQHILCICLHISLHTIWMSSRSCFPKTSSLCTKYVFTRPDLSFKCWFFPSTECDFFHPQAASDPQPLLYKKNVKCTLVQALRLCTGCTARRGSRGIALLLHDHGTRRGWGVSVTSRPFLPPGKTRYPVYRRLGGPQGKSGQVRKISPPPRFDLRTLQPIASRYTNYFTWPQTLLYRFSEVRITFCLRTSLQLNDLSGSVLLVRLHFAEKCNLWVISSSLWNFLQSSVAFSSSPNTTISNLFRSIIKLHRFTCIRLDIRHI